MALQDQQIRIPFAGGVDTQSDPKQVAPARLIALENGVFTKRTTITKRSGYDELGQTLDVGSDYTSPERLATRGDELLLFADDWLLSYRPSSDTWSRVGRAQSVSHTEAPIARTGTDQDQPDIASNGGITVVAWEDSRGGVWWSLVETATGRILRAPEQLDADGQRPRCLAVGAVLHIVYAEPANFRLWCAVINPDTYLDTVTPAILTEDLSSTVPTYDAEPTERTGTPAAIAWSRQGGGYRVGYLDASGVLGSPVTGHPSVGTWADTVEGPISVAYGDQISEFGQVPGLMVTWATSATQIDTRISDGEDPAAELGSFPILTNTTQLAERIASVWQRDENGYDERCWVWVEQGAALLQDHITEASWFDGTSVTNEDAPVRGHGLASRGVRVGLSVYVVLAHEVPFFPYAALMRYDDVDGWLGDDPTRSIVGRMVVGVSDGMPLRTHLPSVEVDADDPTIVRWPATYREQVDADPDGAQFLETGIKLVTFDFEPDDPFQSAPFGRGIVIAGACPLRYDGLDVAEAGFSTAPDGTIAAVKAGGGSMTASSTYLYGIAYEEVDAQGEIHQGPISVGPAVALGVGETKVTLSIPTYRLTTKRRVRIGVFRTEADQQDAEAPAMYRVSSLDPSATGNNGYVANDTTVDTVTFVDVLSDTNLLLRERAYTFGGVLSNDTPPMGSAIGAGKDRLFWSDPSAPGIVRFSQGRREGYGPDLAGDLRLSLGTTDPVVAVAVMDQALFAFTARQIYYVTGDGPLPNPDDPNSPGFTRAAPVPGDVGCTAPRSVAITPIGVVFQSAKGICVLEPGRGVRYIGAPVEAYNAQRITFAAHLPDSTRVLFLSDERTLLYDYQHDQWSTFTNHEGDSGAVVAGVFYYLRHNGGRVFKENRDSKRDGNNAIRLALETAWLHLVEWLQGWQWFGCVSILGTYQGPHTLRIRLGLDYETGWSEPYNLDVDANYNPSEYGEGSYGAGVYGGGDDHETRYQRQLHIGAAGQAIRFRFEDVASTGDLAESYELSELLLEGGILRGTPHLGEDRSD